MTTDPATTMPDHGRTTIREIAILAAATILITLLLTALAFALAGDARPVPAGQHRPSIWVVIHLATVIPAIPLGAWLLARQRKGDTAHKIGGRIWVALMVVTALSSFGLRSITGGLSPLHFFSVLTLVSVPLAIYRARQGNIIAHRAAMTGVYIGLVIAGLFAFMPGRLLGLWLFG